MSEQTMKPISVADAAAVGAENVVFVTTNLAGEPREFRVAAVTAPYMGTPSAYRVALENSSFVVRRGADLLHLRT